MGTWEESLGKANANRPNAGKAGEAHMAVILVFPSDSSMTEMRRRKEFS